MELQLVKDLRSCCKLSDGLKLHARILELGIEKVPSLDTAVVHMYLACGSLKDARKSFDNMMPARDSALWTSMIAAYAQKGDFGEAVRLLQRMLDEALELEAGTVVTLLNFCSSLAEARLVHKLIQGSLLEWNPAVGDALVRVYSRCGSLEDARKVFDNESYERNVVSWTSMISFYVEKHMHEEALKIFFRMLQEGVTPNRVTFVCVLNSCGLEQGRRIHRCISELGLESDAFAGNALLKMYRKTGSLEEACLVFEGISSRNLLVWSSMISGYSQFGRALEALKLFWLMQLDGCKPDKHTVLSLLDVCSSSSKLQALDIFQLHSLALETGLDLDTVVATSLIKMSSEQGDLEKARILFEKISHRDLPAWNCMIAALAKHRALGEALELLEQMKASGLKPNKLTYLSILSACDRSSSLEIGRRIHREIVEQQLKLDAVLGTGLLKMYGSCGSLSEAEAIFQHISEIQDVVSWTAMIGVYADSKLEQEALKTFRRLMLEGQHPDKVTLARVFASCTSFFTGRALHKLVSEETSFESETLLVNSLLLMYSACQSLKDVQKTFNRMLKPTLVSWNILLAALAQNDREDDAFKLFLEMEQSGISPDSFTLSTIINSTSSLKLFQRGRLVHQSLVEAGVKIDAPLAISLLNLYGKCGHLREVREIFSKCRESDSVALWNSMLAAEGRASEAALVFLRMLQHGVEPDVATFVSLLSKCSHAGVVEQACMLFGSMRADHGISQTGEHFGCMIDLLGRAGWADEARELARRMPVAPDVVKLTPLLSELVQHHQQLEPGVDSVLEHSTSGTYSLISNALRFQEVL